MITNSRTVTIKMSRGTACKLMVLCASEYAVKTLRGEQPPKWLVDAHDKIVDAIKKLDESEGGNAQ